MGHRIVMVLGPKVLVTVFLTLQVATMVLVLRYSMVTTSYVRPTAVIMGEVVKLCVSFIGMGAVGLTTGNPEASLAVDLLSLADLRGLMRMAVPALLYLLQNNLLFFAMANVDASTYQVTYQLKTLTTAACSVLMLGIRLSRPQWLALLALSVGVATCQYKPAANTGLSTGHENQGAGLSLWWRPVSRAASQEYTPRKS